MWSDVHEFKEWWLKHGRPLRPPFELPTLTTDLAYSLCLYREGEFQIELYVLKPDSTSPPHKHPGVDSVFVYLGGNLEFGDKDNIFKSTAEFQFEKENGTHALFGSTAEALDGELHSVRTFEAGGAFLSFEHWKDRKPTSVVLNWEGDPDGEKHQGLWDKHNGITFQVEPLHPFVDEAKELFEKHYHEIAERTDVIKLDPDYAKYDDLANKNMLEVHTIRNDGKLVGYSLWFISQHIHYKNSLTVNSDILFISPEFRQGITGVKFIKWSTEKIKERNPQRIMFHVKDAVDYSPILKRMGAKHFESIYTIVRE
jgi:hypothetical protein